MAKIARPRKNGERSTKAIARRGRKPGTAIATSTQFNTVKDVERYAFGMSQQVLKEGLEPDRAHILSLGWFRGGLKAIDCQIQIEKTQLSRDRFEHQRLGVVA